MTARGPEITDTPIAGLVELALRVPTLQRLIEFAGERPDDLALVGPASARLFVACALARGGPLLVVTATGREAEDLAAELRGVLGDAVAMFPSWETLPHERLSPGVDTVGARSADSTSPAIGASVISGPRAVMMSPLYGGRPSSKSGRATSRIR